MIEPDARVVAVHSGRAWVESVRKSACGACSASSGCGTSAVTTLFGDRGSRLEISDPIGERVGDRVVIGIVEAALTRASLLAYLLPLIALMLAALVARSAGVGEGSGALVGVLGLCVGLWVTGWLTRGRAGRETYRSVLVRRTEPRGFLVAPPVRVEATPSRRGDENVAKDPLAPVRGRGPGRGG
jgi:sigma-E factor negative regulatory protein RseC